MVLRRRPRIIANEILLKRSQHPGAFLVLEGRDDRLFCERYTDAECDLVVAEGKGSVLDVIDILDGHGFAGVLGVVDSDFDSLEGVARRGPNVVAFDAHDLEMALVCSPAFERLLLEFGSRAKIRAAGGEARRLVLSAASSIGYLRWLSKRESLDLTFQGLKLAAFVDRGSLAIDGERLCKSVVALSKATRISEAELKQRAEDLRDDGHDLCHVCCGDDALGVLSISLRKALGTNRAQDVGVDRLRQSLRLAFEGADFRESSLGVAIAKWEERNPGFCVLKR